MKWNIKDILRDLDEGSEEQRIDTWVAKFKGRVLILRSGKHSWKKESHTKIALNNDFKSYFWHDGVVGFKDSKELVDYLIEKKLITIERL
jgi:hypothetical protein